MFLLWCNKVDFLFLMFGILLLENKAFCSELLTTTLSVDETEIIRKVPKELLGLNHNWIHSEQLVWDKKKNTLSSEVEKILSGFPMPLNRMAGSDSQTFEWKQAIGSISGRAEQQLAPHDIKAKKFFGPLEWVQSTLAFYPKAEFSWVFNMKTDSPSDHADLVELLTGDGIINPNGGINWAKKRIDFGLKEPVPVKIWELGNEMDWAGGNFDWSLEKYTQGCEQIINEVRKVNPNAAIAVQAATAPMGRHYRFKDWRRWHRTALEKFGPQINYITYHAYYYAGVPISVHEKYLSVIRDDILAITGSDRIKIYISEHATWPPKPTMKGKKWEDNWYKTHSLHGCLLTAQFLNCMLQRKEVTAAAYHSLSAGPWGIIYSDPLWWNASSGGEDNFFYTTGIFDLLTFFNEALGKHVVSSSADGTRTDVKAASCTFSGTVMTTGDKGLTLIMVNLEPENPREILFKFKKTYSLIEKKIISAQKTGSYNTKKEKKIMVNTGYFSKKRRFTSYIMPAKSIVVLKLQRNINSPAYAK